MSKKNNETNPSGKMRLVVYATDLEYLTGRKYRTCLNMLRRIRKAEGKVRGHLVTVDEVCRHLKLNEAMVIRQINIQNIK